MSLKILRKSLRVHLKDSTYLEERDPSGDHEKGSEDVLMHTQDSLCSWKKEISLEILRKSLRMHLQDCLYLEESDPSGDLEEVSEDAFARQPVPGRKRSLWRS